MNFIAIYINWKFKFLGKWLYDYLWSGSQMHRPVFIGSGHFGRAHQLIGSAAQEVATRFVAQRPSAQTVIGDADLEASSSVPFFRFAQNVSERIDG